MNLSKLKLGQTIYIQADAKKRFETYKKLHPATKKTVQDFESEEPSNERRSPEKVKEDSAKVQKDYNDFEAKMIDKYSKLARKPGQPKIDNITDVLDHMSPQEKAKIKELRKPVSVHEGRHRAKQVEKVKKQTPVAESHPKVKEAGEKIAKSPEFKNEIKKFMKDDILMKEWKGQPSDSDFLQLAKDLTEKQKDLDVLDFSDSNNLKHEAVRTALVKPAVKYLKDNWKAIQDGTLK